MHRQLLGLMAGDPLEADHRDGDKLNCQRSNLRVVTHAENAQNGTSLGGTSQHRGVCWNSLTGRWLAYAQLDGRFRNLGHHDSEEEAAGASEAFRRAYMPYSEERVAS